MRGLNLALLAFTLLFAHSCNVPDSSSIEHDAVNDDTAKALVQINEWVNKGNKRGTNSLKPGIAYIDSALLLARDLNVDEQKAYCQLNKAMLYANYRYFDSTLFYVNQALDYYGRAPYSSDQTMCFMLASDVYAEMRKYSKAHEYYIRGVNSSEKENDSVAILKAKVYGVVLLAKQKKYDESLALGYECSRIMQQLPFTDKVSLEYNNVYNNLAAVYASMGVVDSADVYFEKSLQVAKTRQDSQLISFIFDNLSRNYAYNKEFDKAIGYSDSSSLYMNAQRPRFYQGYLRNRILLQKHLGDYEGSLETARKLIQELDTSIVRIKRLTTEELLYDLEKLNYTNRLLQVENERMVAETKLSRRNLVLVIIIMLFVSLLFIFFVERRRAKIKILVENQKTQVANEKLEVVTKMQNIHAEHVKKEAVMIQKQQIAIQLHNTVANGLAGILFRMKNTDRYSGCVEIQKRLQDIYEELRSVIESEVYFSQNQYFRSVEEFKSFVLTYFEEMPIDVDITNRGEVNLENIPTENLAIVGMALKEIFVNALKYSNCNKISVSIVQQDSMIEINVKDNGIGFDVQALNVNKKTGLMSVKQEVEQLAFGVFEIESEAEKGTKIKIRFAR